MKPSLMRPPAIGDVYDHKLTYQNHLKKLSQIRQDRKTQLQNTVNRNIQLQHIKQGKSRTFANKFNEQNVQINQSNLRFLVKLQKIKPFTHYSSVNTYDRNVREQSQVVVNPVNKRKIIETEKENNRIFYKMKSVSSKLGHQKMASEYSKAQKIKDRIAKYVSQDNKIELKSQKFFGNKSIISNKSLRQSSHKSLKKNVAQYYQKNDIIKNRISNTDRYLKKKQESLLPNLKDKEIKVDDYTDDFMEEKVQGKQTQRAKVQSFFTTEPPKKKRSVTQTRKIKGK